MKDSYRRVNLVRLCRLLGVTRQAYYQFFWQAQDRSTEIGLLLEEVRRLRRDHPVMGGRKLYCLLQPFFLEHQIKLGRDALFQVLWEHGLLVRRRRRATRTTFSHHWFKKYPNCIKGWDPQLPGQLWVADITYVPYAKGYLYLSLITDAYSHKVMGYYMGDTLEAVHTVEALKMALTQADTKQPLIHHSDRGLQYCSQAYVSLLQQHNIKISMTQSSDPLDNPIAERINGIIKNEYLVHNRIENLKTAQVLLEQTIVKYNQLRPHCSIDLLTPEYVHNKQLHVNKKWRRTTN